MKDICWLIVVCLLVQLSSCNVIDISSQKDLKKFLRTHTNVLIFYQETSRSGRDWLPILNEAAELIDGKGSIIHVDCSAARKLCKRMKASPAPTLLKHYKDGKFHKDYDRIKSSKSLHRFLEDPTSDIPWDEDETAHSVIHLNSEKSLVRLVTRESKPILLMFYAPWCGFCKQLKPEFASAAEELKQEAVLAGMDVDKPDLTGIRSQFNITGYPTLYYIHRGRVLYKFGGEKNKEGIVAWMRNPQPPKLPDEEKKWADEDDAVNIHFLVAENFDAFLKQNPSVLVMFYAPWCGHCKAMKPAYGEAATKLRKEGIVGALVAIDATKESSIAERYKVQGFPTVKYFKNGEYAFDFNERSAEKLVEFMKDPKEPPPPPPPESAWSEQQSEVHHLTTDTYHAFLRKKKHVLVMMYAPWCGHCKKAKPEFTRAADVMKENRKVSFAAVDCSQHSDLCTREGAEGYPTFLHYSFGRKNPKGYSLGRDEEDFVAFMSDPDNPKPPGQRKHWKAVEGFEDILFLDEANFETNLRQVDALFVKFYAPWCGHCKAMKPAFAQLAGFVRNTVPRVAVGAVDATVDEALAAKFGVTGYPTLLYITPDGNHEKYRGARNVDDMLIYIREKNEKTDTNTIVEKQPEAPPKPDEPAATRKDSTQGEKKSHSETVETKSEEIVQPHLEKPKQRETEPQPEQVKTPKTVEEVMKKTSEGKKPKIEEVKGKPKAEEAKPKASEDKKPKIEEAKPKTSEDKKPKVVEAKPKASEEKKRKVEEAKPKASEDKKRKVEEAKPKTSEDKKPKIEEAKPKTSEDKKPKVVEAKPKTSEDKKPKVVEAKLKTSKDKKPKVVEAKPNPSEDKKRKVEEAKLKTSEEKKPKIVEAKPKASEEKKPKVEAKLKTSEEKVDAESDKQKTRNKNKPKAEEVKVKKTSEEKKPPKAKEAKQKSETKEETIASDKRRQEQTKAGTNSVKEKSKNKKEEL